MNKAIVNAVSDEVFRSAVEESYNFADLAEKLGMKRAVGESTRKKLKNRIQKMNLKFKEKPNENPIIEKISSYKNSKEVGVVGEKKLEYECAKMRVPCFKDPNELYQFDYILLLHNNAVKIQVKTIEFVSKNGTITFYFKHGDFYANSGIQHYSTSEVDYFYCYCIETDESFLVKNSDDVNSIMFRNLPTKNNQTKGINKKKDYLFKNIISAI